jgi:hypothetical protein
MAIETSRPVAQVAKELGIHEATLGVGARLDVLSPVQVNVLALTTSSRPSVMDG